MPDKPITRAELREELDAFKRELLDELREDSARVSGAMDQVLDNIIRFRRGEESLETWVEAVEPRNCEAELVSAAGRARPA